MTGRRFVSTLAQGAIVAFGVALSFVGCSRQGEGERCDFNAAGNTDCDEGLVCVTCPELRTGTVDRCCPAPGAETDVDCQRADVERVGECGATISTGGTSGNAGSGGAGGAGTMGGMSGTGQGGSSGTSGEGGAPDAAGAGGA
jgi:hypothetical protein